MAEYHIGCGAFGIYAGTLNSRNKNIWQSKSECTDEALEEYEVVCDECACNEGNMTGKKIMLKAFDLITRQKAEIERLQKTQDDIDNVARDLCKERMLKGKAIADFEDLQEYIRKEKSEAIREFAKRLKKKTYPFPCAIGVENAVTIRGIDDLVEEMEGENG